jgi:hypothetical protein
VPNAIRSPATPIQIRVLLRALPGLVSDHVVRDHPHFRVGLLPSVVCRTYGRDEIDRETPHIEREYQRDGPFDYSCRIIAFPVTENSKCDTQGDLDDDKHELDTKGDTQDAEVPVMDPETVVLPADEDGRDYIPSTVCLLLDLSLVGVMHMIAHT